MEAKNNNSKICLAHKEKCARHLSYNVGWINLGLLSIIILRIAWGIILKFMTDEAYCKIFITIVMSNSHFNITLQSKKKSFAYIIDASSNSIKSLHSCELRELIFFDDKWNCETMHANKFVKSNFPFPRCFSFESVCAGKKTRK